MNLFIDTNVYLGFYSNRKGSSETLLKLKRLIEKKEIRLILPEQVKDEFHRNLTKFALDFDKQANAFLAAMNNFHIPAVLEDWGEAKKFEELRESLKGVCKKAQKEYVTRLGSAKGIINETIEEIFRIAEFFPASKEVIELAQLRKFRGNPPGKKEDDGGDAIVWETLKANVKNDLYFVTYDNDWGDPLDSKKFNSFLATECKERKQKIYYFSSIGEALNSIAEKKVVSEVFIKDEKALKTFFETVSQLGEISNTFKNLNNPFINLAQAIEFNAPSINIPHNQYTAVLGDPYYQAVTEAQRMLNFTKTPDVRVPTAEKPQIK